ncbi:MAG: helix-turn-helix transcriptional regulator [Sphingopyxis sp.]|nr:helix-turn-helix transcriptional regulator [Sphingopyxis sp.]
MLRSARSAQGISQFELANRIGVSQRHLGFLELGRAQPSRGMLLAILDELALPRPLRNATLLAAGFPPDIAASAQNNTEFGDALHAMLEAHSPWPAVLFNADWVSLGLNHAATRLCQIVMPETRSWNFETGSVDMIDAVADPSGLLAVAKDGKGIASLLLSQFRAEAWARPSLSDRVCCCAAELEQRFGKLDTSVGDAGVAYFLISFDTPLGTLSFRRFQLVPGIPQDINTHSPRIELWFPTDHETRNVLQGWASLRDGSR